jgi:hypothetical protein
MNLLRIQKKDAHNFQALIEKFTDIPNSLVAMLSTTQRIICWYIASVN